MPRSSHDLLALCALLDVDPFALVAVTRGGQILRAASAFSTARMLLWLTPSLSFVSEFFGRKAVWPPLSLGPKALPLAAYFPSQWFTSDFEHVATDSTGFYQSVELRSRTGGGPKVWHVAYRPAIVTGQWLHYGVVARFEDSTRLLNARGYLVEQPTTSDRPTFFETWFGPEAAVFRVASLHQFSCRLVDATGPDEQTLRFVG